MPAFQATLLEILFRCAKGAGAGSEGPLLAVLEPHPTLEAGFRDILVKKTSVVDLSAEFRSLLVKFNASLGESTTVRSVQV